MQLSLAAELCTRSELPDTGESGRLLRMNGERSRAVDMAFGLAEEKLVREDRDHRRRRGKKPRSARARRDRESDASGKNADPAMGHRLRYSPC